MPDPSIVREIVSQGGFAVLAAFMAFMGWKAQQEAQRLQSRTLDVLERASAAQAALVTSNDGLRQEIAGLRSGIHSVRELMVVFEQRLMHVERKVGT